MMTEGRKHARVSEEDNDDENDKRRKSVVVLSEGVPGLEGLLQLCSSSPLLVEAYRAYQHGCFVASMGCIVSAAVQDLYAKLKAFKGQETSEARMLQEWDAHVNDYKWVWENVEKGLPKLLQQFSLVSESESKDWEALILERNRCVHPHLDVANEGFYVPMPETVARYIRLVATQLVLRSLRYGTVSKQKAALLALLGSTSSPINEIRGLIEKVIAPMHTFNPHALGQVAFEAFRRFIIDGETDCKTAAAHVDALCYTADARSRFVKDLKSLLQRSTTNEQCKRLWSIVEKCASVRFDDSPIPSVLLCSINDQPPTHDEAYLHLVTRAAFLPTRGVCWDALRRKLLDVVLSQEGIVSHEESLIAFLNLLPASVRIDEGIARLDGGSTFEANNGVLQAFVIPVMRSITSGQEERIRSIADRGHNNQVANCWGFSKTLLPFLEKRRVARE